MPLPKNPRRLVLAGLTLSAMLAVPAHSENRKDQDADFSGAGDLLKQLEQLRSPAAQPDPAAAKDPAAEFLKDLDAFPAYSATLPPEQAAKAWLDLFDRYQAIVQRNSIPPAQEVRLQNLACLLNVLPGPETWPALQKLIESRHSGKDADRRMDIILSFFIHTLNHQESAQWADLKALDQPVSGGARSEYSSVVFFLGQKLSLVASDKDALEAFWTGIPLPPSGDPRFQSVVLPDFVAVLGRDKAASLLSRLLVSPNLTIGSIRGEDTANLARSLALQCIDKIVVPPWSLTETIDAEDLYEALVKKFGAPANEQRAIAYHIMRLILNNHADAAAQATTATPNLNLDGPLNSAVEKGYGPQIYDFLHALLAKTPQTDLWDLYVDVAAQTGQAAQALQFVRGTSARTDLTPEARKAVNGVLYKALLANNDIDEGVAGLRRQIQASRSQASGALDTLVNLDLDLARIGRLLKNRDWEQEGVKSAVNDLKRPVDPAFDSQARDLASARGAMIDYYMTAGDEHAAAALQVRAIVDQARIAIPAEQKSSDPNTLMQLMTPYSSFTRNLREGLVRLATIYDRAHRYADVIRILEEVPWWGAGDLLPLAGEKADIERHSMPTLALVTAHALAETGRLDEARTVLDYDLRIDGADDAAYALFLKIGKGDLTARLDRLFLQDQFEPRPLIWKAALLLQQGKVDEAEATCKQAIAIDPSDGHSGKGDRMRVYSVMSDICAAKKDTAQAAFFGSVVSAIRLSEDADDFFDAGLLTRAIAMYQEALGHFSDAYCIQARIARQLATLGRLDEAAIHYRKAFELMPDSFGRMESHCFGCERAFEGKTAVKTAEDTFTSLLAKEPQKPQVHYLMGYLMKEEGRYDEAVPFFRQAVELDPDYINAWNQILDAGEHCRLPGDLRDKATFNLIRLDPSGRHDSPSLEEVTDLAGLWQAIAAAGKTIPPRPASLFKLTASVKRMESLKAKLAATGNPGLGFYENSLEQEDPEAVGRTPRQALQQNSLIQYMSEFR